jgi:type IV pilus assembly protein PilW
MNTACTHPRPQARQRGLSLIELMISIVIGLILLLGIAQLIVQQSSSRSELEKSSRQIENGRYAMQLLHTDLQQAGYYGMFYSLPAYAPAAGDPATPALPDPCKLTLANMYADLSLPIQGYDNALPAANFTCALDGANNANNALNYKAGTDILVIRRLSTAVDAGDPVIFNTAASGATATTTTALASSYYYVQTIGNSAVMGIGAGAPVNSLTYPLNLSTRSTSTVIYAPLRKYIVRVYFISPCSVPAGGGTSCTGSSDDGGHPIPTLKVLELGVSPTGQPTFILTPLVEGIENMQLEYGVDGDSTVATASAVDGYPDAYCIDPNNTGTCTTPNNFPALSGTNPTNWQNVMAVRINLLARNTECTTGYTDTKQYKLGALAPTAAASAPAVACPAGSDYKRHVFSEVVRLVNASGRRAQQ